MSERLITLYPTADFPQPAEELFAYLDAVSHEIEKNTELKTKIDACINDCLVYGTGYFYVDGETYGK